MFERLPAILCRASGASKSLVSSKTTNLGNHPQVRCLKTSPGPGPAPGHHPHHKKHRFIKKKQRACARLSRCSSALAQRDPSATTRCHARGLGLGGAHHAVLLVLRHSETSRSDRTARRSCSRSSRGTVRVPMCSKSCFRECFRIESVGKGSPFSM